MLIRYAFLFLSLEILYPKHAISKEIAFKVSHEEAAKLASEAYSNSDKYKEYMDDIKDWPTSPPFYLLTIGDTGTFAINPWTGEVWDSWQCKKIHTATLLQRQAKVKKRFTTVELLSYHRLSAMKPYFMGFCDPNSMH